MDDDLPSAPAERALALQELLVSHVTDGNESDVIYQQLRREFLGEELTASLLPKFVRSCRTLSSVRGWAKLQSQHWEPRRIAVRDAFSPLLDHLEGRLVSPIEEPAQLVLSRFDADGVHSAWKKAMKRRSEDPEGAITAAKTLLETVCKHILEVRDLNYGPNDDLPKLYGQVAKDLNLAPSQHTEEAFKTILGGCHSIVNALSTIRNRIGDAHGQGSRAVKPAPRHAALAVNLSGAVATFLLETLEYKTK